MATRNHLRDIMVSVARRLRAEFQASEVIAHAGMRGASRESVVCDFLRTYLPGHVEAAHGGEIITAAGDVSRQCDILIFDRSTPPFLDTDIHRIVPNECVFGLVEVKSHLSKAELIDACDKIRQAKMLRKTAYYGPEDGYREGRPQQHFPTVGMIFAFDGPSLESTLMNLREWTSGRFNLEWPDTIWILGKGFLCWRSPTRSSYNLTPWIDDEPTFVPVPPEQDILFPLAIALNIYFARAWMNPLRLADYAGDIPLSAPVRKSFGGYAARVSAAGWWSQSGGCWRFCSFCSCRSIRAIRSSRSAGVNFHLKGRAVAL